MLKIIFFYRLESYIRNDNFGREQQTEPEWNMEHPDLSGYRDLNKDSGIPKMKKKALVNFLQNFDAELQEKPKDMYKDKFLAYIRHVKEGDKLFIHACCRSEMRKGTSYYIDIYMDQHGIPQETQCDCGSGK